MLCALSWEAGWILGLSTLAASGEGAELASLIGSPGPGCWIGAGRATGRLPRVLRLLGGVGLNANWRGSGGGCAREGAGPSGRGRIPGRGRGLEMKGVLDQPGEPTVRGAELHRVIDAEAQPGRGGAKAGA